MGLLADTISALRFNVGFKRKLGHVHLGFPNLGQIPHCSRLSFHGHVHHDSPSIGEATPKELRMRLLSGLNEYGFSSIFLMQVLRVRNKVLNCPFSVVCRGIGPPSMNLTPEQCMQK